MDTKNYGVYLKEDDCLKDFIRGEIKILVKLGIKSEYALVYVVSGCFLLRCSASRLPRQFAEILQEERISQKDKSEKFLSTVILFKEKENDKLA